jgi:hypothetical protein
MEHQTVELFKKDKGQWVSLGHAFATLTPCACTYPLRKNGQERYEGKAYEVMMRHEQRILETERLVAFEQEFFLMTTVGKNKK